MKSSITDNPETRDEDEHDIVWGARQIGKVLNRKENEVYYLLRLGVLDPAIRRFGHRTIAASRSALRALVIK